MSAESRTPKRPVAKRGGYQPVARGQAPTSPPPKPPVFRRFLYALRPPIAQYADALESENIELRKMLTHQLNDPAPPGSMARVWEEENARLQRELNDLFNEVDCRIEHGANSGGHLEYVRSRLGVILDGL